ncbi:MAG: hypothetical protein LC107_01995 [Chitinophagales bacterium]|nr:hypothetical protein [Chitinophagales bacterium]
MNIKSKIVLTILAVIFFTSIGFGQYHLPSYTPLIHTGSDSLNLRTKFKPYIYKIKEGVLPSESYAESLPLFCKMEHYFEKSSKINLRVRLGALDYVNRLENK